MYINIHKKNDPQIFMCVVSGQIAREERLSAEYRAEISELTSHAKKLIRKSFSLRRVGDIISYYYLLTFLLLVI